MRGVLQIPALRGWPRFPRFTHEPTQQDSLARVKPVASWLILALLLSAVTINYIDRGSLSVAAPAMTREFSLSPGQLGWLFSAFFWIAFSYGLFKRA